MTCSRPRGGPAWNCWCGPRAAAAAAAQAVRWSTARWLIERSHDVLKSGCRTEQLQPATAARLGRALATYALVAWRLLWLTYAARHRPGASCAEVPRPEEWQV